MITAEARTKVDLAREMARQGYGWEDLVVKLGISKEGARWFVFGKTGK